MSKIVEDVKITKKDLLELIENEAYISIENEYNRIKEEYDAKIAERNKLDIDMSTIPGMERIKNKMDAIIDSKLFDITKLHTNINAHNLYYGQSMNTFPLLDDILSEPLRSINLLRHNEYYVNISNNITIVSDNEFNYTEKLTEDEIKVLCDHFTNKNNIYKDIHNLLVEAYKLKNTAANIKSQVRKASASLTIKALSSSEEGKALLDMMKNPVKLQELVGFNVKD